MLNGFLLCLWLLFSLSANAAVQPSPVPDDIDQIKVENSMVLSREVDGLDKSIYLEMSYLFQEGEFVLYGGKGPFERHRHQYYVMEVKDVTITVKGSADPLIAILSRVNGGKLVSNSLSVNGATTFVVPQIVYSGRGTDSKRSDTLELIFVFESGQPQTFTLKNVVESLRPKQSVLLRALEDKFRGMSPHLLARYYADLFFNLKSNATRDKPILMKILSENRYVDNLVRKINERFLAKNATEAVSLNLEQEDFIRGLEGALNDREAQGVYARRTLVELDAFLRNMANLEFTNLNFASKLFAILDKNFTTLKPSADLMTNLMLMELNARILFGRYDSEPYDPYVFEFAAVDKMWLRLLELYPELRAGSSQLPNRKRMELMMSVRSLVEHYVDFRAGYYQRVFSVEVRESSPLLKDLMAYKALFKTEGREAKWRQNRLVRSLTGYWVLLGSVVSPKYACRRVFMN